MHWVAEAGSLKGQTEAHMRPELSKIPNLHFHLNYAMNVRPIEEGKLNTIVTPEIAFSHLFCYFSNAISGESSVLSQHFINRPKMVSSLK